MRTGVIILIVIGTILIFAFSMLAQGSPPLDPFLPYTDLLSKDQTASAVVKRKIACIFVLLEANCAFKPNEDVFSKIVVTLVGGIPSTISFQVNPDALRIGDLIMLWGKPDTVFPYSAPRLLWSEEDGITRNALVPPADRLNYLAPVKVVSFTF